MKELLCSMFLLCSLLVPGTRLFAQAGGRGEAEAAKAKMILRSYKEALEALDGAKASVLFAENSRIYESGGVEGTFAHYLEHHLGPEFKAFTSFRYSDYKAEVTVEGPYAFATETYLYTIVLAKNGSAVKRKGVATSTLKKVDGNWRILFYHSSSRTPE